MNHFIQKTSDLPIIHKLNSAYAAWQQILINFPKSSRSTLGNKIDLLLLETTELLFVSATSTKEEKLPLLVKANLKLDLAKFLLQIAWQLKTIDNKKYIWISTELEDVGKMLGGWKNELKKKLPQEAGE